MNDRRFAPVYKRIEEDLREQVRAGRWRAGMMVPGRRELAEQYGVTPPTMMKAIRALLDDGTLKTRGSRGTFVSETIPVSLPETAASPVSNSDADGAAPPLEAYLPARRSHVSTDPHVSGAANAEPIRRSSTDLKHVGIVASYGSPTDFWTRITFQRIEETLNEAGVQATLFNVAATDGADGRSFADGVRHLASIQIDGLILLLFHDDELLPPNELEPHRHAHNSERSWREVSSVLAQYNIPTVIISSVKPSYLSVHVFAHVHFDQKYCGYQAVQHLIKVGCSDLTFLLPFTVPWLDDRVAGANEAVQDAGPRVTLKYFPAEPDRGYSIHRHGDLGYQLGLEWWRSKAASKAIICPNDRVAQGFIRASHELGKRFGSDFVVIGCDDDYFSASLGLTTLRPPLELLAEEATTLLLQNRYKDRGVIQVRLHPTVIQRASTRLFVDG